MSRGERWGLAGIVAVALALRFPTLGLQSFWFDEAQTADVLHRGLGDVVTSAVPDTQNFPPLYFALAWLWAKVFGHGDVALRSLPAVCGTLTVAAAWWAGRALASVRAGLIAAAIAATSPLLVWYSQEARPYALLALLSALSIALFARARERPDGRRVAAWAVCCALALATHYFAAFVIVPEAVLLLVGAGRVRPLVLGVAGLAVEAAALLPLALHQRSSGRAESIALSPLGDRARTLPNRLLLGEQGDPSGDYGRVHLLLYALAPLALAALWLAWRRSAAGERRGARTAAIVAACGVGVPLVLALAGYDYVVDRNLLAAWVAVAVVLACGLAAGGRAGLVVAGLFVALSAAVVVAVDATPRLRRDDWRAVARSLCRPHPRRALVVTPPLGALPLRFYLPDARPLRAGEGRFAEVDTLTIRGPRPAARPVVAGVAPPATGSAADLAALALPNEGVAVPPALLVEPAASRCVR